MHSESLILFSFSSRSQTQFGNALVLETLFPLLVSIISPFPRLEFVSRLRLYEARQADFELRISNFNESLQHFEDEDENEITVTSARSRKPSELNSAYRISLANDLDKGHLTSRSEKTAF